MGYAPRKFLNLRVIWAQQIQLLVPAQYQEIQSLNLYSKLSVNIFHLRIKPPKSFKVCLSLGLPLASISICCLFTLCLTTGTQPQEANLCCSQAEMLCYFTTDSSHIASYLHMILSLVQRHIEIKHIGYLKLKTIKLKTT